MTGREEHPDADLHPRPAARGRQAPRRAAGRRPGPTTPASPRRARRRCRRATPTRTGSRSRSRPTSDAPTGAGGLGRRGPGRRRQAGRLDVARRRRQAPPAGRTPAGSGTRARSTRWPPGCWSAASAGRPGCWGTSPSTDKTYTATIRLGVAHHHRRRRGRGRSRERAGRRRPTRRSRAAMAALTGDIEQVPSSVSAIKVDGQRAYARVRAGEDVELAARPVAGVPLRAASSGGATELDVEVDCSTGTYIRALARDLGAALGCGGHLTALRRTRVGGVRPRGRAVAGRAGRGRFGRGGAAAAGRRGRAARSRAATSRPRRRASSPSGGRLAASGRGRCWSAPSRRTGRWSPCSRTATTRRSRSWCSRRPERGQEGTEASSAVLRVAGLRPARTQRRRQDDDRRHAHHPGDPDRRASAFVGGIDVVAPPGARQAAARGRVAAEHPRPPADRVGEPLLPRPPVRHRRPASRGAMADELLEKFQLSKWAKASVYALSGGMAQRLMVARSIFHRPGRALHGRADGRPRPAEPPGAVGDPRRAERRGPDDPAHHPLHGGGRPALRPGGDHGPRPDPGPRHARPRSSRASAPTPS